MLSNELKWLQSYYLECCNGDWEHTYGIKIDTLDNPGWSFEVDLRDMNLEDIPFEEIQVNRSGSDWLFCRVDNKKFQGRGGPENLEEIVNIFKVWVEENE